MKDFIYPLALALCLAGMASAQTPTPNSGTEKTQSIFDKLVWSDEFDTDGPLDPEKWFHQTRLPDGGSWFNGEIQHYTDRIENAEVKNGVLHLTARRETFTDQGQTKQFTSARLNSKFAFTYGRVEVRAKLPSGVGTWPAIWTLGKNITETGAYWQTQGFGTTGWPACGEMDIMEHWGSNQNVVSSATHTPSSYGNTVNKGEQYLATASTGFHVYTLEWTPDQLVFSVDGTVHFTYDPPVKNSSTWPFNKEQYLLLNVAILPNITPSFTSSAMEVDYVRVYQEGSTSTEDVAFDPIAVAYPNPFDREVSVPLTDISDQDTRVAIYTIDGRRVSSYAAQITGGMLILSNLGELSAGTYFAQFTADEQRYTVKIVKGS